MIRFKTCTFEINYNYNPYIMLQSVTLSKKRPLPSSGGGRFAVFIYLFILSFPVACRGGAASSGKSYTARR